jgi:hypothetical protein
MEYVATKFNKYILPILAAGTSGFTLGWMVGDNDARKKFHKYHPVPIPQAPMHSFYAYAHTDEAFKDIQETLAETHNDVEKLYRQKQQSKVCAIQ